MASRQSRCSAALVSIWMDRSSEFCTTNTFISASRPETIGEYKKRKAKPFEPFEGRKGKSKGYYEVPVEILESPVDL